MKDLSDANRAVNRLKQTGDVGLPIRAIPLAFLRTVSILDAALGLDCPDGSTQGDFMVGFTTSALHQQGSAAMSPMSWSSHTVKRKVSAFVAGEVFLMSEGLAECEWIGLSRLRTLITSTEIDIITRGAHGDRHEGGKPSAD